jgi:hypothetical protein
MIKKIIPIAFLFSLFFAQNTSTSNIIIPSIKAMLPGIATSMTSGAIMQLVCPFSTNRQISPLHLLFMTFMSAFGFAETYHNLEKAEITGISSFITPIAAFVAGFYGYAIGTGIAGGIKDMCLDLYNLDLYNKEIDQTKQKQHSKKLLHDSTQAQIIGEQKL